MRYTSALVLFALGSHAPASGQEPVPRPSPVRTNYRDWKISGGSAQNIRYSALDQINRNNVSKLEIAWTFNTQDAFPGSEMECTPIVVDGVLYATSPRLRVFAMDAG